MDEIGQAILEHDTLDNTGGPFSSTTGEVLASGDANPPELPWLLNKMYSWQIQNNPGTKEDWKQNIYNTATKLYGTGSEFKYPKLYNDFHKNRMQAMREKISGSTPEELWEIVTKYRKKHRLGDRQDKFPAPTLLKAASLLYHGSPHDLDILAADRTKHGQTGYVFATPSKAHASIFALDRQWVVEQIAKQIHKDRINVKNISYGQWKNPVSDKALDSVDVYVDTDDKFQPFSLDQQGYIYSIDTTPYMNKIKKWKHDNGEREVLIQGDVKPTKQEEISIRYNVLPGRAPAE